MVTPSFGGAQDVPLLTTKLYIPPARPNLAPRPRLTERLKAGLHRKLTLISAPAGFGKTTLLSEWAHCSSPFPPSGVCLCKSHHWDIIGAISADCSL